MGKSLPASHTEFLTRPDLQLRPVFHYSASRVRAHAFLCMLAYCMEWYMRHCLKPMLIDDKFITDAQKTRPELIGVSEPSGRVVRAQRV